MYADSIYIFEQDLAAIINLSQVEPATPWMCSPLLSEVRRRRHTRAVDDFRDFPVEADHQFALDLTEVPVKRRRGHITYPFFTLTSH